MRRALVLFASHLLPPIASRAWARTRPAFALPPPPVARRGGGGGRPGPNMVPTSSSAGSDAPSPDRFRIGYLSDVEGHWDYFLECIRRSNVLDWEETDVPPTTTGDGNVVHFRRLSLRPNAHFVYGGDAVDKGPGDIRLVRALVSLKRRHPDRVHLLVGNRDLNKLRLPSELSDADMARPIDDVAGPFWNPRAISLREHLERAAGGSGGGVEVANTRAERLRYMLEHTMGCPETFEFRRREVRILKGVYGEYPPGVEMRDVTPVHARFEGGEGSDIDVTDEEVVDSFLYEMGPEGSLRQYLDLSSIAAIIGNTIFVHGAIDSMTMKFVPSPGTKFRLPTTTPPPFDSPRASTHPDGYVVEDVHEWVRSLNDYLSRSLRDFDARPEWNDDRTSRGGEAALAIQCRPAMWGRSVVCNSYADGGVILTPESLREREEALRSARERSDPLAFEGLASDVTDPAPASWLLDHGVRRLVVGHKPTGDCPAVLSSHYTGVEVVAVDTSYSNRADLGRDEVGGRFGGSRGDAVAMVEIAGGDAHRNRLETFGVLACGAEYSNEFPYLEGSEADGELRGGGDPCLGRMLSDGWWVKAAVPPNYHLCRGSGRFVEYRVRPMRDVVEEMGLRLRSDGASS